jgi:hypothetical protein
VLERVEGDPRAESVRRLRELTTPASSPQPS